MTHRRPDLQVLDCRMDIVSNGRTFKQARNLPSYSPSCRFKYVIHGTSHRITSFDALYDLTDDALRQNRCDSHALCQLIAIIGLLLYLPFMRLCGFRYFALRCEFVHDKG